MGFGFNNHLGSNFGFNSGGLSNYFGNQFSIEKSFYLDGVNEYFTIPNADIVNIMSGTAKSFTIAFVMKRVKLGDVRFFNNLSTNGFLFRFDSANSLDILTKDSGVTKQIKTTSLTDLSDFYIVSVSIDGTTPSNSKIYINGAAATLSANTLSGQTDDSGLDFSLGDNEYINYFGLKSGTHTLDEHISWYNNGKPKEAAKVFGDFDFDFNPDRSTSTAQFTVDCLNGISITSSNMEDEDLSPLTPYTTPIQDIVNKYSFINAWSMANYGINGTTSTAEDYLGVHDLTNPAVANQPTFIGGDGYINNYPSSYFVTDDYLYKAVSNYNSGASTGSIHAVFTTNADVTSTQGIFSSCDQSSTAYHALLIISLGKIKVNFRNTTASGTRYEVTCDTTPMSINTSYAVSVYQNGSTLQVLINGVAQSLTIVDGTAETYWFADIPNRDNISIGSIVQTTTIYSDLDIAFVGVSDDFADATVLSTHEELNDVYGCYLTAEAPLTIEKSFYVDGVNKYFNADSLVANISTDTVGTMSAMVKLNDLSFSTFQVIFSFGDTDANSFVELYLDNTTGKLNAQCNLSGAKWTLKTTTTPFVNNDWYFIQIVQDGVSPILYVNGVAVSQSFTVSTDKTQWLNGISVDNCRIGNLNHNSLGEGFFFKGYISQVSYINQNLSAQDIAYIYNSGDVRNVQTLLGNKCKFLFNADNSGDTAQFTVADSINGINAVSVNMVDADKTPITPYADPIADLVTTYGFLNAWSGENIEINGTTTTAKDYASEHDLSNGTIASQPTFVGGSADFNNRPIITFDGVDDYLTKSVSNWRSADSSGVVVIVSKKVVGVANTLFTSSDASSTTFISFGYANTLQSLKTGTFLVSGATLINTNDVVVSAYASNGTITSAFLNGVNDTDVTSSDWFDLYPTQRDDITIGAILRSSPFYNVSEIAFVGYLPYTDEATIIALSNELKTIFNIS